MTMFTLAVCAEMVFRDLPIDERARRLRDEGFQVVDVEAAAARVADQADADADARELGERCETAPEIAVVDDYLVAPAPLETLSEQAQSLARALQQRDVSGVAMEHRGGLGSHRVEQLGSAELARVGIRQGAEHLRCRANVARRQRPERRMVEIDALLRHRKLALAQGLDHDTDIIARRVGVGPQGQTRWA